MTMSIPTQQRPETEASMYRVETFNPAASLEDLGMHPEERQLIDITVRQTVGIRRHRGGEALPRGVRFVACAAAQEDGTHTNVSFDPINLVGAAAESDHPMIGALRTQTLSAALAKTSPHELPNAALRSADHASLQPYAAVDTIPKDRYAQDYDDYLNLKSEPQPLGFRILSHGRLVYQDQPNSPNVSLLIRDEAGCRRIPKGQSGVFRLRPGRNVIITTSDSQDDSHLYADEVAEIIDSTEDPYINYPAETAKTIAKQVLTARDESQRAGTTMVAIVDVKGWADERPRWRRMLDYVRPSTIGFAAVKAFTKLDVERREMYEAQTRAGRVWRNVARSVDAIGGMAGVAFIYSIGRSVLQAKGILPEKQLSSFWSDMHFTHSPDDISHAKLEAHLHAPDTTDTLPTPDNEAVEPETPATPVHPIERTAVASDPALHGKASCVWRWSELALSDVAKDEGLNKHQLQELIHNENVIEKINTGFYHENPSVGHDPDHVVDDGKSYPVTEQYEAAQKAVHDYKVEHHIDDPAPAETPPSKVEPVLVPPTETPAPTTSAPTPLNIQSNDWFTRTFDSIVWSMENDRNNFALRATAIGAASTAGIAWTGETIKQSRAKKKVDTKDRRHTNQQAPGRHHLRTSNPREAISTSRA
jgi:hypothetical protein